MKKSLTCLVASLLCMGALVGCSISELASSFINSENSGSSSAAPSDNSDASASSEASNDSQESESSHDSLLFPECCARQHPLL